MSFRALIRDMFYSLGQRFTSYGNVLLLGAKSAKMRALMRGVDEVGAVIFVPLILTEPLLRSIAIPWNQWQKGNDRVRAMIN